MEALISVGTRCNNHCHSCHSHGRSEVNDTRSGVHHKIEEAARAGCTGVVFTGGEPTIRPELLKWALHASKHGMSVGLVSNGRMLSYLPCLDRLVKAGLRHVRLSLHGGRPEVHDSIVGVNAFNQTLSALEALVERGVEVVVCAVVSGRNREHLGELVEKLRGRPGVRLRFSLMVPRSAEQISELEGAGGVSSLAAALKGVIQAATGGEPALPVEHEGFPLCLLPGLEELEAAHPVFGNESFLELSEPVLRPEGVSLREHGDRCGECSLQSRCPGLHRGYREALGDGELVPLPRLRSNSFNYVFERTLQWPPGAGCPVLDRVSAFDRGRQLMVRSGETTTLYSTRTNDFSDRELDGIKRRFGQIYLDVSTKCAPDDFARDLRKLELLKECRECPKVDACMNCYHPVEDNVFDRDDQQVVTILKSLRGRVLDVGCGDSRYKRELGELVASGRVEYHGVEPDADMAKSLMGSCQWAKVIVSPVEELVLLDESYDHILILRSYNHFSSPKEVVEKLSKALKPGGHLLIADNVAFGLVRTVEQAQRGESGPAVFEHFRNHCGEEAREAVALEWLSLKSALDINPDTSNQWVLEFEKTVG